MVRIALVDDDRNIVESLSVFFKAEGYHVSAWHDGVSALEGLKHSPPDIAVLDVKMPRMDGMELLKKLRTSHDFPVIFLTSRDDEIDEVLGLNIGADDFIRKPCSNRLLAERVKAVLRRAGSQTTADRDAPEPMRRGPLVLDHERHMCLWNDSELRLTVTEFLILEALARRPGVVKSRDQLMDAAYGDHVYVDDRTIDSHIKRLRRKFRDVDSSFDAIDTLYGVGYLFNVRN